MQNLIKLFPFVSVIFSEDGISSSEAQRKKEENKNWVEKQLEILKWDKNKVYKTVREILSNGEVKTFDSFPLKSITIEDFNVLVQIAERNKESAIYGSGINRKEDLRKQVEALTNDEISKFFGIELPSFNKQSPVKKQASKHPSIDYYCNVDNLEQLFIHASQELIEKISTLYFKGLEIEAKAAAYGKQVTEKDCMLRQISKAPQILERNVQNNNSMLVYETPVLYIDKEEFEKLEAKILAEYTEFQMERNSIMKQIKDIARELQRQYDVEYSNALTAYSQEYTKHTQQLNAGVALCEAKKTELLQEVAALKIRLA